MTERDYILVSDLPKARAADRLLRDMQPGGNGLARPHVRAAILRLGKEITRLELAVGVAMGQG